MEEHNSSLSPQESASSRSASALRDLQQRAQTTLASSRQQAARLEAEINQQLDAIAATLSEQTALDTQSSVEAETYHAEVLRLTEELELSRATWRAERAELESHCDELTQKLSDLELQREDLCRKVSALEAHSDDISPKVISLEAQRDELAQKLNGLETENVKFSGKIAALETEREELSKQIVAIESKSDDLAKKVARLETERDDLTQIASNYEVQRNDLSAMVAALESERDDLTRTVAALELQIQSSQTEWRNQLLDFESRLREQQGSWTEQRLEWTQTRTGLERERDELQHKFDLALQDLQRLRARGAELEQELARRPQSNQADSAELVALRAQRDALISRVEELEQRPAAPIDANVEQQLSDLQRRFELAVEDLREYKTKNAKLESQLAASGNRLSTPASDVGGNDWESQKRRLLAALEDSSNAPQTPVEKQHRITIEGTIEMTDAVVAEKDRQIADLQAQIAAGHSAAGESEHTRKINDLVDADEIIAEHRKRVSELEREMQEKLRAAELELSVERAKMARQKAELEELKSELESKQQELANSGGAPTAQGHPKRRWRDKLGLSGDE